MKKHFHYYNIAPKSPLFKVLTYKSDQIIRPGQRVKIPLGKKEVIGLVLEKIKDEAGKLDARGESFKIKEISGIDCRYPPLKPERILWLKWMSKYYHYPLGLIADFSFPKKNIPKKADKITNSAGLSVNQNSVSQSKTEEMKNVFPRKVFKPLHKKNLALTLEQKACVQKILKSGAFAVHLIYGVTGSGKTEIYKELVSHFLQKGRQALILLPEISLTPQLVKRFSETFFDETALLHSQISEKQKRTVWEEINAGKKNLLIGTRSALFCPLPRLGVIIVDEEHDGSFKQDDNFCYHARDSAIVLAQKANIPIVLGSATPDFSSYKNALDGAYKLYELKSRPAQTELPKVHVVDLKTKPSEGRPFWLSDILFNKIHDTVRKGRQTALFLNRRGQAGALICSQCGHVQKCRNCDISLRLHKDGLLLCHYCSYLEKKPEHCPACKGTIWLEKGIGAQKVQESLEKLFPDYKIFRADRDSINSEEEMKQFIKIVEQKSAQIIIGTQMLSKGLDFPSISLVGLILADLDFYMPDFKAEERAFQTLLQMAGRAGRKSPGEVILQTFNPEHPGILFARRHNYTGFFYEEMKNRERWSYPPFSRLCLVRIDSLKEKAGQDFAENLGQKAISLSARGITILGPSPAPFVKIKNRWRFQILIKAESHQTLDSFLRAFLPKIRKKTFINVKVDRDPGFML